MKDYYTVLGVPRGAATEQVRAAYRRLAEDPDNRPRLSEIEEAYALLSDPGARDIYDQTLRLQATEAPRPAYAASGVAPSPRPLARPAPVEPSGRSFGFWVLLLAAVLIAGGFAAYGHFSREQERLRLERERDIQARAQQVEAERRQRQEAAEADEQERHRRREIEELERKNQLEAERALDDVARRSETAQREAERDAERQAWEERRRERERLIALEREEQERQERQERNRQIIERALDR